MQRRRPSSRLASSPRSMDRDLVPKVPSSASPTQGLENEEDEEEKMDIRVKTCPAFWRLSFFVNPSYTIRRLILEMEKVFSHRRYSSGNNDIAEHVRSLEKTCVLLFKGKDLFEHPDRTLQQWGLKDADELTVCDKRPFSINISMHKRESVKVQLDVHDTIPSLKDKIQTMVGIPVEKQRLCYVYSDRRKHLAIADDYIPLRDYGIMKSWERYGKSQECEDQIWLYTDNDPQLQLGHFYPMHVASASSTYLSSWMEIDIIFCLHDQFLRIAVQSYYTVNQLIRMIQEIKRSEKICMLVFRCKNLLEHGSSTLGDLGIKDQDKLLIPANGPLNIVIAISPSSFGQQQEETRRYDLQFDVEASWTVLELKEKIKNYRNIPVKRQRLCYVHEGLDDEKCHLIMHDSITLAAYGIGIMQARHFVGLYFEDDHPTEEDEGGPP